MRLIVFWLAWMASSLLVSAEEPYRDFTNQEGKVIRARLVGKEHGLAILRKADGKDYRVTIDKLAQKDKEYVDTWTPEKERTEELRELDVAEIFKAKGYSGTEFTVNQGHIFVDAKLNDKEITFLIDTGAMFTALDKSFAGEMGLKVREGEAMAVGLSGVPEPIGKAKAKITIGGVSSEKREFGVVDLKRVSKIGGQPFDGILGYDFLSDMEVVIDYRGKTLYMLHSE